MFACLNAADPGPGRDEGDCKDGDTRADQGEYQISAKEQKDAEAEHAASSERVSGVACGDADEGRGDVVGHVEANSDLGRGLASAAWLKKLGGAEDEKRGCDVAHLEGGHRDEQPTEAAL